MIPKRHLGGSVLKHFYMIRGVGRDVQRKESCSHDFSGSQARSYSGSILSKTAIFPKKEGRKR